MGRPRSGQQNLCFSKIVGTSGRCIFESMHISDAIWPTNKASGVADWAFEYVFIDDSPLVAQRITDIESVDVDGDGKLDVWVPGEGDPSDYQMA